MPVVVARPRVIRRRPAPMSEDEADAIQRRVKEAERSRERRQDRPPNPNKDGFGEAEWDDQKHVWISRQEGDNPQIMTWDSQKSIWQSKTLYLCCLTKGRA